MARRRYQKGSIKFIRGKFIGRWREDVVLPGGKVERVNRKKVLGTKADFATKREAQRALDILLAPVNSLTYRPVHRVSFFEFAERWIANVLPTYKVGGSQSTTRKQVRNRLVPALGDFTLQEITTEVIQGYVAGLQKQNYSPKYIRNLISTLSAMWEIAVAWSYVTHKPVQGVILPQAVKPEAEQYTVEETMRMFAAATEPLRTFLWIAGETGMRPAEVCGLDAKAIDLRSRVISVWQSVSLCYIVAPKTAAGYRDFAISEELAEHLRMFLNGKREGLLFQTPEGRPWRESKVVERKLNPLLDKLGIEHFGKGLKALRHWNSTEMDRQGAPIKVRQTRLGHDDPRTTLGMRNRGGYTHIVSADDRAVAAQFGSMFGRVLCPDVSSEQSASGED
ncbi:MAG TPA: tyrosine-type recombinase/integrase [Terracidiphilus sp.]|nr:tyrosine-type recombinase/integrase [Terracidiphilus sp.]